MTGDGISKYSDEVADRESTTRPVLFVCFLIGALGFSGLSFYITRVQLGLPYYLPEIILPPLFLVCWKPVRGHFKRLIQGLMANPWLSLSLIAWCALVGIGYAYTSDLRAVMSTARPFLYIVLLAHAFARSPAPGWQTLFWVAIGAIVGELVIAHFFPLLYGHDPQRGVVGFNIMAVFIANVVPVLKRRGGLQIVAVVLTGLAVVLSAYRIVLVVGGLALVVSHGFMLLRGSSGRLRMVLAAGIGIALAVLVVSQYADVFGLDRYTEFRVVTRTARLLHGDVVGSQDVARLEQMGWIWGRFGEAALPKGFVTVGLGMVGTHNDVPIVQLYDTIGSLFTVLLLAWLLWVGVDCLLRELSNPSFGVDTVAALAVPLFGLLLLTNGRFLYITYECWLFGLLLGRWFARTRRHHPRHGHAFLQP